MLRGERWKILEIGSDCAQKNGDVRANPGFDDILEVASKVSIDPFLFWISRGQLAVEEHFDTAPFGRVYRSIPEMTRRGNEPLASASLLQSQQCAHQADGWSLHAEKRIRSEWADHLIVSHVDDPEIPLVSRALPCNR